MSFRLGCSLLRLQQGAGRARFTQASASRRHVRTRRRLPFISLQPRRRHVRTRRRPSFILLQPRVHFLSSLRPTYVCFALELALIHSERSDELPYLYSLLRLLMAIAAR